MAPKLKIGQFNIDGLKNKKKIFETFLLKQNFDIICLNEVTSNRKFKFKGYQPFYKPRPPGYGGGLITLVKNNLKAVEKAPKTALGDTQALITEIFLQDKSKLTIANVYCSPGKKLNKDLLHEITKINTKCIILGDLNAHCLHLDGRKDNTAGRTLYNFILQSNFIYHNKGMLTYTDRRSGVKSSIDVILCNPALKPKLGKAYMSNDLGSDHRSVIFDLHLKAQLEAKKVQENFVYKEANWIKFRQILNDKIESIQFDLETSIDIDIKAEMISEIILKAAKESIPIKKQKSYHSPPLPFWILNMITLKNNLRREYLSTRDPDTKNLVNRLEKEIKHNIKNVEKENVNKISNKIKNLKPNSSEFYKEYNNLAQKAGDKEDKLPPLRKDQNSSTYADDDMSKANLFADMLEKTFDVQNSLNQNYQNKVKIDKFRQVIDRKIDESNFNHSGILTKLITRKDFDKSLKNSKCKKSPGTDKVQAEMLHQLPDTWKVELILFFNHVNTAKHYPNNWKFGKVVMIKKPKKPPDLITSYRPICLTSQIGKLYERIITERMSTYMEERSKYHRYQTGFRKNKSTNDHLVRLVSDIDKGFHLTNKPKSTAALLMDFSKAFDSVWHDAILYKMLLLGFQLEDISLILNYLKNRKFEVHVNDSKSEVKNIKAGVPQGGIISPTLFNIFTHDLPDEKIEASQSKSGSFADDASGWKTAVLIEILETGIQEIIDEFENWSNLWRLSLNPEKCSIIIFEYFKNRTRNAFPTNINVYLNGHNIEVKSFDDLLGLRLDKELNWKEHLKKIHGKTYPRGDTIKYLKHRGFLTSQQTIQLYTSLIRSCYEYATPAWYLKDNKMLDFIQVIQNNYLRLAYKPARNVIFNPSTEELHERAKIPMIETRFNQLTKNYFEKNRENSVLEQVFENISLPRYKRTGWNSKVCELLES